jgi:hypothetical protein
MEFQVEGLSHKSRGTQLDTFLEVRPKTLLPMLILRMIIKNNTSNNDDK